jgi:hypothetical protein
MPLKKGISCIPQSILHLLRLRDKEFEKIINNDCGTYSPYIGSEILGWLSARKLAPPDY